jgi:transcriptional regulator with XRE-family HTH domain
MTPLTLAVRNAIRRSNLTITEVAEKLEIQRTTLSNRLTKANPLDIEDPSDQGLVMRVAHVIGVKPEEIFLEAERLSQSETRPAEPPDANLVSLLMRTLEDPEALPEHKMAARQTLMRFLGLKT